MYSHLAKKYKTMASTSLTQGRNWGQGRKGSLLIGPPGSWQQSQGENRGRCSSCPTPHKSSLLGLSCGVPQVNSGSLFSLAWFSLSTLVRTIKATTPPAGNWRWAQSSCLGQPGQTLAWSSLPSSLCPRKALTTEVCPSSPTQGPLGGFPLG